MTEEILDNDREVPSRRPFHNAVNWSLFRRRQDALDYLTRIRLNAGHELIGGHSRDSIGDYWWVGVRVPSINEWGHPQAINKHGRHGD